MILYGLYINHGGEGMENIQEFYRCLVSDASGRALLRIRDILADSTLSDESCFHRIEAIVRLLEASLICSP